MSDAVATLEKEKLGYHADGMWHHFVNYRCDYCAFDSVVEEQMQRHIAEVHYFKLFGDQVEIPLEAEIFDASGRKVESRRPTHEELAELERRFRQARLEQQAGYEG